jgi:hypothetical protein
MSDVLTPNVFPRNVRFFRELSPLRVLPEGIERKGSSEGDRTKGIERRGSNEGDRTKGIERKRSGEGDRTKEIGRRGIERKGSDEGDRMKGLGGIDFSRTFPLLRVLLRAESIEKCILKKQHKEFTTV